MIYLDLFENQNKRRIKTQKFVKNERRRESSEDK
jgi:hypothetical protein